MSVCVICPLYVWPRLCKSDINELALQTATASTKNQDFWLKVAPSVVRNVHWSARKMFYKRNSRGTWKYLAAVDYQLNEWNVSTNKTMAVTALFDVEWKTNHCSKESHLIKIFDWFHKAAWRRIYAYLVQGGLPSVRRYSITWTNDNFSIRPQTETSVKYE